MPWSQLEADYVTQPTKDIAPTQCVGNLEGSLNAILQRDHKSFRTYERPDCVSRLRNLPGLNSQENCVYGSNFSGIFNDLDRLHYGLPVRGIHGKPMSAENSEILPSCHEHHILAEGTSGIQSLTIVGISTELLRSYIHYCQFPEILVQCHKDTTLDMRPFENLFVSRIFRLFTGPNHIMAGRAFRCRSSVMGIRLPGGVGVKVMPAFSSFQLSDQRRCVNAKPKERPRGPCPAP